jgi:hypothetical protein
MRVKEKVGQLLNVRMQNQSCWRSSTVFLPLESWDFLCKHFHPIIIPVQFYKSQTKLHQFCDLSLITKTTVVSHIMLRIADEGSIKAARKLFGHTFDIGCRNIPPHKGHDVQKLLYSDIVNVVNVSSAENKQALGAAWFKEFILAQGVEFVFEVQRRLLSILVRYSSHMAQSPLVNVRVLLLLRETDAIS